VTTTRTACSSTGGGGSQAVNASVAPRISSVRAERTSPWKVFISIPTATRTVLFLLPRIKAQMQALPQKA
jgi:hypothetical protein